LDFPVTYLTERRKLYRDMEQLCDNMGVSSYVLPSPHEDCPTFDQDNNNCQRGEQEARTLYQNGLQGKTIHDVLDLECDEGGSCPYIDRLDFDPENFDVLIGHYTHGYAKRYTKERVVFLDEFAGDGFVDEITDIGRKVTAFLEKTDLPYSDYEDLLQTRSEPVGKQDFLWWYDQKREVSDREIIDDGSKSIEKRSADLTLALLFLHDLGNGWESTYWYHARDVLIEHPDNGGETTKLPYDPPWRTVFPDDIEVVRKRNTDTLYYRKTPDLSEAESVVALDGTPERSMWRAATGIGWKELRVVPDGEMDNYLHEVMDTEVVNAAPRKKIQTPNGVKDLNGGTKPYSSGKYEYPHEDAGIMLGSWLSTGEKPGLISTAAMIGSENRNEPGVYEKPGYDVIERADGKMNYGSMLSNNEFADKEAGVVLGTPHPGDQEIKKWGAFLGEPITANGKKGVDRSFGPRGDRILLHFRENQVLQAILRFGRQEELSATVFLNHEAHHDWMDVDSRSARVYQAEKMRKAIDALMESDKPLKSKEIAKEADCSRPHVTQNILPKLKDRGFVEQVPNQHEYRWIEDDRANPSQGCESSIMGPIWQSYTPVTDYHDNPTVSVIDEDKQYREQLKDHTHSLEELREIANNKQHPFYTNARDMLRQIGEKD
jgi:hypothetical protein